ncbi:hypothetical protein pb186bvf_013155 [Paramecium bursaria]
MDQNISTLIEQSKRYQGSKNTFFKHKLTLSKNTSPNKEYALTEFLNNQPSSKSKKPPIFSVYLLSYANQNIDSLPKIVQPISIQMVDLQNNRFRCFAKELLQIENLISLNLNGNFIKTLPPNLGKYFKKLKHFQISNNLIVSAQSIFTITSLENIDLSKNRIKKLTNLGQLKNLKQLLIQSNEFQILPFEIIELQNLVELGLDWFKYASPPLCQTQGPQTIERIKQLMRDDDEPDLNFSDEEMYETGIRFQKFIKLISNEKLLPPHNIHKAALEQDIGALLSLISEYPDQINLEDQKHSTALGLAIQEEKYFSAKTLLFNGACVKKGVTAYGSILNLAIVKGQIHLIMDILNQDADPMITDKHGNTALHYCMACFDRDIKVYKQAFQAIIKKNVNPNFLNKDGLSPLHVAIKKGNVEAVQLMIENNKKEIRQFNLNQKSGKKKQSPLHLACQNNYYELVLILLNTNQVRIFQKNAQNEKASDLCKANYRLYKIIMRYEKEQIALFQRNNSISEQDDYSQIDEDDNYYTDLEESIQQFDALQKIFKINRSVLGNKQKATGKQYRQYSLQKCNH